MRVFRSWAFDCGLALILAGVIAVYQGTTTHHPADMPRNVTISRLLYDTSTTSFTDVSDVAWAGVLAAVSGVAVMVVGAVLVRRHR